MTVNKISFTGLKQTKKGNIYQKKNTGKRIGTAVGLIGGIAVTTLSPSVMIKSLDTSFKLMGKGIPIGPKAIMGAIILGATLLGRTIGSISDSIINKRRKTEADIKTQNNN